MGHPPVPQRPALCLNHRQKSDVFCRTVTFASTNSCRPSPRDPEGKGDEEKQLHPDTMASWEQAEVETRSPSVPVHELALGFAGHWRCL